MLSYQLFRKYGRDYGIAELLEGTLGDNHYQEILDMAKNSGFDEKMTVIGLLVEGLNDALTKYEKMDKKVSLLYERLQQVKSFLEGNETVRCLEEFIAEKKESLQVKIKMELISMLDSSREQEVLDCLEAYDLVLKEAHILDKTAGFERIKELFWQETQKRKELQSEVKAMMQRAFSFVSQAFGQGQEMLLLVTTLTRNQRAMKFISAYGCDEFFRYSEELLLVRPERELQEACQKLLSEKDRTMK